LQPAGTRSAARTLARRIQSAAGMTGDSACKSRIDGHPAESYSPQGCAHISTPIHCDSQWVASQFVNFLHAALRQESAP